MRLVFFASDPIALPALEWLGAEGRAAAELAGIFTGPDRPSGRGQKAQPNAIKAWAAGRGLPVFQPEKLAEADGDRLRELQADVSLVMAYGQILRESFIAIPRLATLNLHASILPKFRGASPVPSAIAAGERETGVCLMRIVRQLDAGPVADCERVSIGRLDTGTEIEGRIAAACPALLARSLPRLERGELPFVPQDGAQASYCRRLRREDGRLDWNAPATALASRINGLFPWPACVIEAGGQIVKIGQADAVASAPGSAPPGEVLGAEIEGLLVQAGGGVVRLRRLQRSGGRMLPAAEFLRGFPIPAGTRLASQAMADLVSAGPR